MGWDGTRLQKKKPHVEKADMWIIERKTVMPIRQLQATTPE